jgi:hypothetical protein
MEGRGHRAAGVARGRHQDVQRPRGIRPQPLQRGGQEAGAEILERGGRTVEQLEYRELAVHADRVQRRGKIEGIAHDGADVSADGITRGEGLQENFGHVRQRAHAIEGAERNRRPALGNVQATIRRQAL